MKRRTQKDFEASVRDRIRAIPGVELSVGYNKPIWITLLGPSPEGARGPHQGHPREDVARSRASPTSSSSLKAQNPAITIKVDNELASDLGLTVLADRQRRAPVAWRET